MSKVRKIPIKKASDHKISHYPSLSLINPFHTLSTFNQSTEKPEPSTESPYAQKLTKVRSISTLKDPSGYHPSGMISPPLSNKYSMSLKSKLNLNSSFVSKVKDPNESQIKLKKKPVYAERKSSDTQPSFIDIKLNQISLKHKENGISNEILDKYRECFEEIISKDKQFGALLAKIKFGYEDWIRSKSEGFSESAKLKSELHEFSRKLADEMEENSRLLKKIQKFTRENVELGRALDERDSNCKTLQDHLLKITNIEVDEVPKDKTSWKVLIAENKGYSDLCAKLKRKLKGLKAQEKKLMELFWILKQKGYPIEEIYESLNTKKHKISSTPSIDEVSDHDYIVAEPKLIKSRPSNVPSLNMGQVEPNSFTESEEDQISLSN